MERINVSDAWRLNYCDATFKMEFENTADKSIALKAMREAIEAINYTGGYAAIWLQDLEDDSTENGFNITSTLDCEEINLCIPAMCKAVAKALPDNPFKGYACKDDLKCYWIDDYEFSYDGKVLHIKETFMDDECGYFCPDCGFCVAPADAVFEDDEIECEDCEECLKVSDGTISQQLYYRNTTA